MVSSGRPSPLVTGDVSSVSVEAPVSSPTAANRQVATVERYVPETDFSVPASPDLELKTDVRPYLLRGFLVIAVTFGGVGGWAATAPLDGAALAPGTVVVESGRQKIQHPEGGVVLEMFVRDGDRVEKGDLLLRLDPTRAEAERDIVEGGYVAALAGEARLLDELRGSEEIAFPEELLRSADRPDVARAIDVQREIFDSRATLQRDRDRVLSSQIAQARTEIEALEAERRSTRRQLALIEEELASQESLFDQGLTLKAQVLELQRTKESLHGSALGLDARIAGIRSRIGEIEGQMTLGKSEFHDQLVQNLEEVQLKLLQSREELIGADDTLQRIDIRSPVSGRVVANDVVTVGGVVSPAEAIMEIVPDQDDLVVDARLAVQDVDLVKIGQSTNVMLTAFNQATTPTLIGEVTYLGADRQIDESTGKPYFQVKIAVPEDELERLESGQTLLAGMPADTIIVTGERTVLQYLLEPITRSLARSWHEA